MRSLPLLWLLLCPATAFAQALDEVPLADVLEVLVLDRELVALDARSGNTCCTFTTAPRCISTPLLHLWFRPGSRKA